MLKGWTNQETRGKNGQPPSDQQELNKAKSKNSSSWDSPLQSHRFR